MRQRTDSGTAGSATSSTEPSDVAVVPWVAPSWDEIVFGTRRRKSE